MRRTAVRLASCVLAGTAPLLVAVLAAGAEPAQQPGGEPGVVRSAPLAAPAPTALHGRKLV